MTDPSQRTPPPRTDGGAVPPPFDGWDFGGTAPTARGLPDPSALVALVEALRRLVPVELQSQLNSLQRELLLTIRALIDWYLERLDGAERPPRVEDIPID